MDFDSFIFQFKDRFPPYKKYIDSFKVYTATSVLLNDLIALLSEVDVSEFERIETNRDLQLSQWKTQAEVILTAIESFQNGNVVDCYNKIFEFYFWEGEGIEKKLFFKPIPERSPFYRMRVNNKNSLFSNSEMFYIPFDLSHLVSNQRFSLSGYPCLYLGTSTYGC